MPRRDRVTAGVDAFHMQVSQIRAQSARSSSPWSRRKAGMEREPDSSSPSRKMVTRHGRAPVAAFHARQASTKVFSCALSSDEPRPRISCEPSGRVSTAGAKGSLVHRFSGSTGCTS